MLTEALNKFRPRRYPLLLPLRVWVKSWGKAKQPQNAQPDRQEETITENISSAGCYFLLDAEPELGSTVDMEIKMAPAPGASPGSTVRCRGRVVRVEKVQITGKTGVGCAIDTYRIVPPSKKS
jgi:hypothetical protein